MALLIGDPAPDFTLYQSDRTPWTLSDHRGAPVLLLFIPGAFTSVCTEELCGVNADLRRYNDSRTTVACLSTDSPFVLAAYARAHDLRFPLLSDHEAEVCARYGAKYDHDFTHMRLDRIARRAVFLVDAVGRLRYAEVLADEEDLPDFAALHRAMEAL